MLNEIQKDAATRMKKSVESLRHDLNRIRTGRASTALLEHIKVKYYGNLTPLSQVATLTVSDARTLSVQPWEKNIVPVIEKAILESNLGLNPISAGTNIRIPIPSMTEERRIEMTKLVRHEGENAKIAVRNIRRDAIHTTRELLKEKEISQDQQKQAEGEYQQLTDKYIAQTDRLIKEKETEIMEV